MYNLSILYKLYIFVKLEGMPTVSATHAKQNFAAMLDQSQREPVRIQRHERDVAVLVSAAEYQRLNRDKWAEFNRLSNLAAEQAQANGLTEEILAEILAK
jgi:prevent-host-death family protein